MDIWFTLFVFVVAIAVAVGFTLVLVAYINALPASFAFGWRAWVPTLFIPVLGPLWFCRQHWADFSRAAKQMVAGVVLIGFALGLTYGVGPSVAERAVQIKKAGVQ